MKWYRIVLKLIVLLAILFFAWVAYIFPVEYYFLLNRRLTTELRVVQVPFTDRYHMTNKYGKPLVKDICYWTITDDYILGRCLDPDDRHFIYNRKNEEVYYYADYSDELRDQIKLLELLPLNMTNEECVWQVQYRIRKYPLK